MSRDRRTAEREDGRPPNQSAVIPFRRTSSGIEVCLIRRKDSTKWSIPKGFIDEDETPAQAALKEAYEEAGLTGRVIGRAIGTYDYEKQEARLTVAVFLMEVADERSKWQEMSVRQRKWWPVAEAKTLLEDHPVAPLMSRVRPL
jgi:ADP-ribose pyrophosphatase YjhB (NUDIX family)